jgi:hypothetical protein
MSKGQDDTVLVVRYIFASLSTDAKDKQASRGK